MEQIKGKFIDLCAASGMDEDTARIIADMYEREKARAQSDYRAATLEQMAWDSLSMEAQAELVRTMLRNEYGEQFERMMVLAADFVRDKYQSVIGEDKSGRKVRP